MEVLKLPSGWMSLPIIMVCLLGAKWDESIKWCVHELRHRDRNKTKKKKGSLLDSEASRPELVTYEL